MQETGRSIEQLDAVRRQMLFPDTHTAPPADASATLTVQPFTTGASQLAAGSGPNPSYHRGQTGQTGQTSHMEQTDQSPELLLQPMAQSLGRQRSWQIIGEALQWPMPLSSDAAPPHQCEPERQLLRQTAAVPLSAGSPELQSLHTLPLCGYTPCPRVRHPQLPLSCHKFPLSFPSEKTHHAQHA